MAEQLNIDTLLAEAERVRAANTAASELAKKNQAKAKIDQRNREAVKGFEVLSSRIVPRLDEIKKQITTEVTLVTAGVRQPEFLKSLVNKYNGLLEEQAGYIKKANDISTGVLTLDSKNKLVSTGKGISETPQGGTVVSGAKTNEDNDGDGIPNISDNLPNFPNPDQKAGTGSYTPGQTVVDQALGNTGGDKGGNKGGNTGGNVVKGKDGSVTPVKPKPKPVVDPNALTPEQQARLGEYGSKYLIDYFKASYPDIYNKLVSMARENSSAANVEAYLSGTAWAKDVNQRTYALIGAAELANGIKLDQVTKDTYRDQYLAKVKSIDEIKYDIGLKTIAQFQLDTVKPDIANSIRAGNTFALAAADYIEIYRKNLEIASSAFKVDDKNFQTLLISSSNISDFEKKLRRTDQYLSQPKVQQQINANKIMVTTKYRQFGLSLTAAAADNLAKNVFLGDTSNEQIDENLRQEAVKLFPAFRDRILNGESPLSIASPYLGAISRILEVPEGSLDLEDPTVRKAMIGTTTTVGDKTSSTVTPLWQFEQDLYKDSRWQYTANARAKADSILVDVGSRFGVIP
jgi:hypothetical protein